jgi:SAM-dependent methyltransferase
VPDQAGGGLEGHEETYREAVEDSISFSGAGLDLFTRIKADLLVELALKHVGEPGGLAFLDVGCGPGETDSFLNGRVDSLAGVDVSSRMVEQARKRNPGVEYRDYRPGEPIPFDDGSYDVCFAICVLHHVPPEQRRGLVNEMKRLCRPGGLLLLLEHNPFNLLTRKAVSNCEFDRGVKLLSRGEVSRLLSEAGLAPRGRYIEFFPRDSELLRRIEARLGWLPLGAQFAVFAQRP